jgi:hypothetical protein
MQLLLAAGAVAAVMTEAVLLPVWDQRQWVAKHLHHLLRAVIFKHLHLCK